MSWFLLALCAAFFSSLRDLHIKIFSQKLDATYIATAQALYSIPLLSVALYFEEIPPLNTAFFFYLLLGAVFSVSYLSFYTKAISLSEVSLVLPLMSFSPIFLIFLSPFLLTEYNSGFALVGVSCICFGIYLLGVQKGSKGLLSPLKNLLNDPGCKLMLLASLCAAFAVSFEKNGVRNSTPTFFALAYTIVNCIGFIVILKFQNKTLKPLVSNVRSLFPVGVYLSLVFLCQVNAYTTGPATYVIAIKRLSIMLTVLSGCLILKESNLKSKLFCVGLMLLGALLISIDSS